GRRLPAHQRAGAHRRARRGACAAGRPPPSRLRARAARAPPRDDRRGPARLRGRDEGRGRHARAAGGGGGRPRARRARGGGGAAPADALAAALAAVPGVRRVDLVTPTNGHARCRVEVEPGRDARAQLAARVTGSGWGLLALAPVETSLEEAFLALVASEEGTSK